MKAPTLETLRLYCEEYGNCLRWVQGVNSAGYPQANIDGKVVMVRRWVYTHLMGKEVIGRQPVVTRCGHRLCVSPGCLYGSTFGAVLRRAYKRGSRTKQSEYVSRLKVAQRQGFAKLSPDQVQAIRDLPEHVTHAEAGRLFGVGAKAASKIRRGLSWRQQAPAASAFNWRP